MSRIRTLSLFAVTASRFTEGLFLSLEILKIGERALLSIQRYPIEKKVLWSFGLLWQKRIMIKRRKKCRDDISIW